MVDVRVKVVYVLVLVGNALRCVCCEGCFDGGYKLVVFVVFVVMNSLVVGGCTVYLLRSFVSFEVLVLYCVLFVVFLLMVLVCICGICGGTCSGLLCYLCFGLVLCVVCGVCADGIGLLKLIQLVDAVPQYHYTWRRLSLGFNFN